MLDTSYAEEWTSRSTFSIFLRRQEDDGMEPEIFVEGWIIPRGEIVLSADYPELAAAMGARGETFPLPDLTYLNGERGKQWPHWLTPIVYCMKLTGSLSGQIAAVPMTAHGYQTLYGLSKRSAEAAVSGGPLSMLP